MYVLCLGLGVPFYSGFLYVWASLLLFWTICLAWAGYCTNTISLYRNTVRIPKVSRTLGTLLRDDVFGRCDRSDVLFLLLFPDIVTAVSFFYSTITYSKCYVQRQWFGLFFGFSIAAIIICLCLGLPLAICLFSSNHSTCEVCVFCVCMCLFLLYCSYLLFKRPVLTNRLYYGVLLLQYLSLLPVNKCYL